MSTPITFTAYAVNNLCYKANRKMPSGSPAGIIVHSTGVNNPNLWRYVDKPDICGVNKYGTHWNVPMPIGGDGKPQKICCHAFVGKDKDGAVRAAKTLPWTMCCWNCGDGAKGSYNYSPAYIQIEVCEDDLTDEAYFNAAFKLTAQLCARLIKNYPTIKLSNIISHKEACVRGYASNHGDCDHWLAKFGKNMDWFRELVANNGEEVVRYRVTGTKTVTKADLGKAQAQLIALGFDVDAEVL